MSKVPSYQLPAKLIRSVYGSPATFGGINVHETCAKMQRAVEILAELREWSKYEARTFETQNLHRRYGHLHALQEEADKLLTELEVQPK